MGNYRNDRAYVAKRDALRRQAKKTGAPCHICHHPFDFTLEWKHPMSFTADHVTPVALGGSMTGELKPAHRSCNSRRQTTSLEELKTIESPKTTRDW